MRVGKFLGGFMTPDGFKPVHAPVEDTPEAGRRRNEASDLWRATVLKSQEIGWFERIEEADRVLIAFWNTFGIGKFEGYSVARERLGWEDEKECGDAA